MQVNRERRTVNPPPITTAPLRPPAYQKRSQATMVISQALEFADGRSELPVVLSASGVVIVAGM
jgi:hypothetical protein